MAMQQKIIRVTGNDRRQFNELLNDGWRIISTNSQSQGYGCSKTCCLGVIFLPLALLGKNKDIVEYVLEKDIEEIKAKNKE